MKYIKWIYLAVWTLIYKLPERSISGLAAVLVLICSLTLIWIQYHDRIVAGQLININTLSNKEQVVVEVDLPWYSSTRLAVVDSLEAPEIYDDEIVWFFGFGNQHLKLNGHDLVVVDYHTSYSGWHFQQMVKRFDLEKAIRKNGNIAAAVGIAVVVLGILLLQAIGACLTGLITLISAWHLYHYGNAISWWQMSEIIVTQLSIITAIAGAAIGMRLSKGWVNWLIVRISAAVLLLVVWELIKINYGDDEIINWPLLIVIIIWPFLSYVITGAVLVSIGMMLTTLQSLIAIAIALFITIKIREYVY